MKLSSLNAFVAVVESGSIHAAARALGVSHPAISKSLRALEEELASPLLTRSTRGVTTTATGAVFYQRTRLALNELQRATQDVTQMREEMEGSLSVGVAPAAAYELVPLAIQGFRQECPRVALQLNDGLPYAAVESLREGLLDLSITQLTDDMQRTEFTIERLISVGMAVVTRHDHPMAQATSLQDLVDQPWLRIGTGPTRGGMLNRLFGKNQLPIPTNCIDSHSLIVALMLLRSGGYFGYMPRNVLAIHQLSELLVEVPVQDPLLTNNLVLLYPADRPLTPSARVFAKHARRAATHILQANGAPSFMPSSDD